MDNKSIFREIRKRPMGLMALIVLGVLYFCAIFAGFLAPYEVSKQQLNKSYHPPTPLRWGEGGMYINGTQANPDDPSRYKVISDEKIPVRFFAKGYRYKLLGMIPMERHLMQIEENDDEARLYLLGSDEMGRDIFSRLLGGAQISLSIGFIGITITMILGFLVGGLSGYFGGKFDFFSMRLIELLMAIPGLYLLLALRSSLAPHFKSDQMYLVIVIILSCIGWATTARIIRGMSLSLSRRPFVLAAQAMGQSTFMILIKHILPNLASFLLVAATLSIPGYILGEAALSFLGLGIQEPSSSWGLMLKQAQQMKVFMLNYWWMLTPGMAIFITVISFNILGDGCRDIIDPKRQDD